MLKIFVRQRPYLKPDAPRMSWEDADGAAVAEEETENDLINLTPFGLPFEEVGEELSTRMGTQLHMWVAIARFKTWVYEVIAAGNNFRGKDGGCAFYYCIHEHDDSWLPYIDDTDCDWEDAEIVIECLRIVKEVAKWEVAPLLVSYAQRGSQEYLVCTDIAGRGYSLGALILLAGFASRFMQVVEYSPSRVSSEYFINIASTRAIFLTQFGC
ncbi:uncharacterized protein BO97DRAFT_52566 [Aspergillus homomorphus CBS 101889]|uniref:Uncharacterized protein n=1 Tax=Aspergillus homomorphus (strain CBS 101889) TaxID=1450537 RepID=A0A395HXQ0_ASPHC|nr:hypothetical protein BO97DRAFT_52566 [Aspergillus homomorphus CBS 101889]RAL12701.1 hypothetical protein BO97DRAFT_52566 [Aspergillus homomorphus CBS 101889]